MNINDFKAGKKVKATDYDAFQPSKIDVNYEWNDRELTALQEQASIKMGELNAFAHLVPNIDHFIRMHVVKEANLSSRIEGTQTNMEEAMLREQDVQPEKRNDWREVNNYINAMNRAVDTLSQLPLSSRLLREAHRTLLTGVRGEHKLPGSFRTSQNWIGGATLRDAVFIPPVFHEVEPLMGDLENFMHRHDNGLTHVMRIALAHYQFETIHPFLDGNGRIGRLMITLYFVSNGILDKPVLYLSAFFEKNKQLYYDNLMRVRTHNDLLRWVKFFLVGIIETATQAIDGLKKILQLKTDCEEKRIYSLGKKTSTAKLLLDALYQKPVMYADEILSATKLSKVSTYKMIEDFERLGILKEVTGHKRNRLFVFREYFEIFEK